MLEKIQSQALMNIHSILMVIFILKVQLGTEQTSQTHINIIISILGYIENILP